MGMSPMINAEENYDKLATFVRDRAKAKGVILIVLDGEYATGVSVQVPSYLITEVPDILRATALDWERTQKA